MKVAVTLAIIAVVASTAWAGPACCAGGAPCKVDTNIVNSAAWSNACTKLNLTDAQQATFREVCLKYCQAGAATAENRSNCIKELEKTFSAEQIQQLKAMAEPKAAPSAPCCKP